LIPEEWNPGYDHFPNEMPGSVARTTTRISVVHFFLSHDKVLAGHSSFRPFGNKTASHDEKGDEVRVRNPKTRYH